MYHHGLRALVIFPVAKANPSLPLNRVASVLQLLWNHAFVSRKPMRESFFYGHSMRAERSSIESGAAWAILIGLCVAGPAAPAFPIVRSCGLER